VGFGTWKAAPGDAATAVQAAFEAGYRHFVRSQLPYTLIICTNMRLNRTAHPSVCPLPQ
jgi:hypothetical protein